MKQIIGGLIAVLALAGCSATAGEDWTAHQCDDIAQAAEEESAGASMEVRNITDIEIAVDHRETYQSGDGGVVMRCSANGRWTGLGKGRVVLELTEKDGKAWYSWEYAL